MSKIIQTYREIYRVLSYIVALLMISSCTVGGTIEVDESIETLGSTSNETVTELLTPTTIQNQVDNDPEVKASLEITKFGRGKINDIAWSPDGSMIAISTSTGIYLYDGMDLSEIQNMKTDCSVSEVLFSIEDDSLIFGDSCAGIQIWDYQNGKLLKTLVDSSDWVGGLAISPDGKLLASGGKEGINLWDIDTGDIQKSFKYNSEIVYDLHFSLDGTKLVSSNDNGRISVWNVDTGEEQCAINMAGAIIDWVDFSPDGMRLVFGGGKVPARLWNIENNERITFLDTCYFGICSYSFSFSEQVLASGGIDGSIRFWDIHTGKLLTSIENSHSSIVTHIAYSPDGESLISIDQIGEVFLWDTSSFRRVAEIKEHPYGIGSAAIASNGTVIAIAATGIWEWTIQPEELSGYWEMDKESGESNRFLSMSSDEKLLAFDKNRNTVILWDRITKEAKRGFSGHEGGVAAISFSQNGSLLATADESNIYIWDTDTGEKIYTFANEFAYPPQILMFSEDETNLFAGSYYDEKIHLWDITSGELSATYHSPHETDNNVFLYQNGKLIEFGITEDTILVWDVVSGEILYTLEDETVISEGDNTDIVIAPDGKTVLYIIYMRGKAEIRLWDIDSGEISKAFPENLESIYYADIVFSADSKLIAYVDDASVIYLWRNPFYD